MNLTKIILISSFITLPNLTFANGVGNNKKIKKIDTEICIKLQEKNTILNNLSIFDESLNDSVISNQKLLRKMNCSDLLIEREQQINNKARDCRHLKIDIDKVQTQISHGAFSSDDERYRLAENKDLLIIKYNKNCK